LKKGQSTTLSLPAEHLAYLVPATGRVSVNGLELNARDGAAIRNETTLEIQALEDAELVLVETAQ
jgi:hypothetical protein